MSPGAAPLPASLAAPPEAPRSAGARAAVPLMLVRVGGRWFALAAHRVEQVAAKGAVTRVPTAARHVLGVTGLRSGLVPVISLEEMIGTVGPPASDPVALPRLVVVRAGDCEIALVVDESRGIIDDLPADIATTPSKAGAPCFMQQEFEWQGKVVFVLDVPQLVASAAGWNLGGV